MLMARGAGGILSDDKTPPGSRSEKDHYHNNQLPVHHTLALRRFYRCIPSRLRSCKKIDSPGSRDEKRPKLSPCALKEGNAQQDRNNSWPFFEDVKRHGSK